MANEFVARKGLVVLGTGIKDSGSISSSIGITAPFFYGDGSQLTNIVAPGTISSSAQFTDPNAPFTGSFLGSLNGTSSWAQNAVTASYVLPTGLPPGLISSSTQLENGSFTGSFLGNVTGTASTASYVEYTNVANKPALVSSSTQIDVRNTTGIETIATTGSNTFVGSQSITGSVSATAGFVGSLIGTASWANNATTSSYVLPSGLPPGLVSSSTQLENGAFTGSFLGNLIGTASWAQNAVTSSYVLPSGLPSGLISSSAQLENGSFTGSFLGNLIGTASWANNVLFDNIVNKPALVSSSTQIDVRNTTGIATIATTGSNTFTGIQNITNTTNSTTWTDGALIVAGGVGIGKDVNISGSLTILGLLTAVSTSIQYVTSSQLLVADNKITVNTNDLLRFGGLSVIDSGSTASTASIYWDSQNHKFIYENISSEPYNSAMFIAGPKNTGALGQEVGLTVNRVPVATGDDHIDSRPESSSIRVDFPSRMTHVEAGLTVTGSVTASIAKIVDVVYTGTTTANIIGPNTPSGQVVSTLPTANYDGAHFDYLIKDGTNFRTGTVMAVWSGGTVVHTDTSTTDIGNTNQASFDVDLNGGNARLKFLVSSGTWTVKTAIRAF